MFFVVVVVVVVFLKKQFVKKHCRICFALETFVLESKEGIMRLRECPERCNSLYNRKYPKTAQNGLFIACHDKCLIGFQLMIFPA